MAKKAHRNTHVAKKARRRKRQSTTVAAQTLSPGASAKVMKTGHTAVGSILTVVAADDTGGMSITPWTVTETGEAKSAAEMMARLELVGGGRAAGAVIGSVRPELVVLELAGRVAEVLPVLLEKAETAGGQLAMLLRTAPGSRIVMLAAGDDTTRSALRGLVGSINSELGEERLADLTGAEIPYPGSQSLVPAGGHHEPVDLDGSEISIDEATAQMEQALAAVGTIG